MKHVSWVNELAHANMNVSENARASQQMALHTTLVRHSVDSSARIETTNCLGEFRTHRQESPHTTFDATTVYLIFSSSAVKV